VPARVAIGARERLGALEEQVQVVLPGETDAAVDLLYRLRGRPRSVTRTPSTCDYRQGDR